jgi:hypothetical protein
MDPLPTSVGSVAESAAGCEANGHAGEPATRCSVESVPHARIGQPRPPIGIYIFAVVLVLIAILCGTAFFVVPIRMKPFIGVVAPICLLFSVGMAMRSNIARLVLIQVLTVLLFLEAILIFNSMRADVPGRLPVVPTTIRILLTAWTLAYLLRRDVRAAFGAIEPHASTGSGDVPTRGSPDDQVVAP